MNLYEITEAYMALDNLEPSEDIKHYLEGISDEYDQKIENITYVIKNNEGDIDALAKEIKRLTDKRKALENKNKYLKDYMFDSMKIIGKDKVKAGTFDLRIQKNPRSVNIIDADLINEEYFRVKTEIDKSKIKKALEEGLIIEGAELVQTEGLRIR
ncbi:siphovirus Gp157 family protein [Anaerococcus cruorum]|uniref:Siphovirus Gp157 family protein n=1 Tax=Anaerococcus cruorum TaxID=3115617 RepID=A0ABW9MW66_9FIRM